MNSANDTERVVMSAEEMSAAVDRIARDIVDATADLDSLVFLGILRRGRPLAERLGRKVEAITGRASRVGSLSTTLYRDDLRSGKAAGIRSAEVTHFDFDVDGSTVVLVDDVLFSGRTVRAALDEVMDYGRPKCVRFACLVDRGLRELPIQPDYLGLALSTRPEDHVEVRLTEVDGEDVVIHKRVAVATGGP